MARVTIIDPTVSTSVVKLRVGVYVTAPVVQAAVSFARAQETNVAPVVSTSSVVLASELAYILINVGAYLDTSGRYQYKADVALVLDALSVAVGKRAIDAIGTIDARKVSIGKYVSDTAVTLDSSTLVDGIEYGIEKRSTETLAVADSFRSTFSKPFNDTYGVTDARTVQAGKKFYEPLVSSDLFSAVLLWSRTFSESVPLVEVKYKAVSLANPIEAASRYVVVGYVFDGYVAVDSAFAKDALRVIIQAYVSGDFFAEDYVGTTLGPY